MSKEYFRAVQMRDGGVFKCFNCNKILARKISGSVYEMEFECPRCHTEIKIRCREPIPIIDEELSGQYSENV